MLIADAINCLCDKGRLIPVEPLDWRVLSSKRAIYASAELYRFLTHKSTDFRTNTDRRNLQALFDQFISGDFVAVALEPTVMGTDIKRLFPPSEEVWEFKVGKKRSQFRIFGRFALLNTFIALTGPADRVTVDYSREILHCQEEWGHLFADIPPLYGSKEHDYISPNGVSLRDS